MAMFGAKVRKISDFDFDYDESESDKLKLMKRIAFECNDAILHQLLCIHQSGAVTYQQMLEVGLLTVLNNNNELREMIVDYKMRQPQPLMFADAKILKKPVRAGD